MSDRKSPGKSVITVIGAGSIGQAIARRVSAGKHVLLADLHREKAAAAADVLSNAGFEVSTTTVDVSSRDSIHQLVGAATTLGEVTGVIHAAGVSPSQASPKTILAVDLYGTAVVLEEFGRVIARGPIRGLAPGAPRPPVLAAVCMVSHPARTTTLVASRVARPRRPRP
jgi:NAD(P)-dependent dehydrogenase (short-subunit alcohol dehydrogenase family)